MGAVLVPVTDLRVALGMLKQATHLATAGLEVGDPVRDKGAQVNPGDYVGIGGGHGLDNAPGSMRFEVDMPESIPS